VIILQIYTNKNSGLL